MLSYKEIEAALEANLGAVDAIRAAYGFEMANRVALLRLLGFEVDTEMVAELVRVFREAM